MPDVRRPPALPLRVLAAPLLRLRPRPARLDRGAIAVHCLELERARQRIVHVGHDADVAVGHARIEAGRGDARQRGQSVRGRGDGLVPVSSLGREYFSYDEAARALVGEHSGTRYAVGDTLQLKLGEANPLTGALKFEVIGSDGAAIEPRGARPEAKKGRSKHPQGQRGRPANIRHQGKRRK